MLEIPFLLIMSIEDFLKKDVHDFLIYSFLFYSFLKFLSNFSLNFSLLLALFFIIFFLIGYFKRLWAIGDLYIFISISLLLYTFQDPLIYLYFIISLSISLIIFSLFYFLIFIRKIKINKKDLLYFLFSIPLFFINIKLAALLLLAILAFILYKENQMIFERKPEELVEGDWVAEDIIVNGKIVISKNNPGLTKKDIEFLKKLYKQGKIKKIKVIEGIPMVPAIFIAYLLTILLKNKVLYLIL